MRPEATIIFFIFSTGLVHSAPYLSNLVDRIVTKLRSKRETGSIRLTEDDQEGPTKKPFPRHGLVPVTILSFVGLVIQVLMLVINSRRHWHRDTVLNWWFTQIAYFVLYHVLIIFVITYPSRFTVTTTHTFPPAFPVFTFKRSSDATNPGPFIQNVGLVLFVLPFIVSLAPYSWYNWYYWRNASFGAPTLVSVAQQAVALVVFVYGTAVRQVYRDREEREDVPTEEEAPTTAPAVTQAGPSV